MPSTYSNNGYILQQDGEGSGIWGDLANLDFLMIDQASDGFVGVAVSSGTVTLSVTDGALSNGRCKTIQFTGSPSATFTVNVNPPNIQKLYWMSNQTSQSMVVSNGAGTAITIPSGSCFPIQTDGMGNVVDLYTKPVFDFLTANQATFTEADTVVIGNLPLPQYLQTQIISNSAAVAVPGGAWFVLTFGSSPGLKLAFGTGLLSEGQQIVFPSGFPTDGSGQVINVSLSSFAASSGQMISASVAYNPTTQIVSAPSKSQSGTGTPSVNIAWNGILFASN